MYNLFNIMVTITYLILFFQMYDEHFILKQAMLLTAHPMCSIFINCFAALYSSYLCHNLEIIRINITHNNYKES